MKSGEKIGHSATTAFRWGDFGGGPRRLMGFFLIEESMDRMARLTGLAPRWCGSANLYHG